MRPATTRCPGTGVVSANLTSRGSPARKRCAVYGTCPSGKPSAVALQVMLHAVVAHHDCVQRQAVAEAAADAVISR